MAKPVKKSNKLDYTALRKQLKAEGPGNLYMLWGPEDYLISDFVSRLKKACLTEGMEDFDHKRLDGPAIDVRDLAEALDAMPFFLADAPLWNCGDLILINVGTRKRRLFLRMCLNGVRL